MPPALAAGTRLTQLAGASNAGPAGDYSGSITAGNTAQTQVGVNDSRHYLLVMNVSLGDLWINFGVAAVLDQPSVKITAGSSFVMESSFVFTDAVSIIGATTGQKFTIKEG